MDPDRQKALLEEYKEAGQFHRLHITLLFGEITVYLAASGALLHFLSSKPAPSLATLAGLLGTFISIAFFVISERANDYSQSARRRAIEVENELGLSLFHHNSLRRAALGGWATATNAGRAVYIAGFVLWLWLSVRQ
jgi:hypothetical protein